MHTLSEDELRNIHHHAAHFHVLASGAEDEARALLKHASRGFKRALHSHMKLIHNSGVHRDKKHEGSDEDADLVERIAQSPALEEDDGLHHELVGAGIRKFFRRAFHAVKTVAHKVSDLVTAPFDIAVNVARGTRTATRQAAGGDFTMLNAGLDATAKGVGIAKDAASIYAAGGAA